MGVFNCTGELQDKSDQIGWFKLRRNKLSILWLREDQLTLAHRLPPDRAIAILRFIGEPLFSGVVARKS